MSVLKHWARVRKAKARAAAARHQVGVPASLLLARARRYPLSVVGIAAGGGFALGCFNVHPLRIPGMTSLLGGSLGAAVTHGSQWLADLAALGLVARHPSDADSGASTDSADAQP